MKVLFDVSFFRKYLFEIQSDRKRERMLHYTDWMPAWLKHHKLSKPKSESKNSNLFSKRVSETQVPSLNNFASVLAGS